MITIQRRGTREKVTVLHYIFTNPELGAKDINNHSIEKGSGHKVPTQTKDFFAIDSSYAELHCVSATLQGRPHAHEQLANTKWTPCFLFCFGCLLFFREKKNIKLGI